MTDKEWIDFVDSIVVEVSPMPLDLIRFFQENPKKAWKKTVEFTLHMVVQRMKERVGQ